MAFTTAQLAAQITNSRNDLQIWANSNLQNQGPMVPAFTTYFNNLQTWITQNGGAQPVWMGQRHRSYLRQRHSGCAAGSRTDGTVQ